MRSIHEREVIKTKGTFNVSSSYDFIKSLMRAGVFQEAQAPG